jgi:hypothetical protein
VGIGSGIFLIAVGAILTWAVHVSTTGVDWHTVGIILMVVGAALVALSFFFWDSWGGYRTVVTRRAPARRVVREDIYDPPA